MKFDKYIPIALILIIIALVIGIGVALFSPFEVTYETLDVSGSAAIDVPKTGDATFIVNENGIKTYQCPSKKVIMHSFNTAEESSIEGSDGFSLTLNEFLDGASDVEVYNDYQIKENNINGTDYYIASIGNETTHDNILIGSGDLDILKHMLDSIVFTAPVIIEDAEVSAVEDDSSEDFSSDETYNDDDGYSDDYSSSSSQTSSSSSSSSSEDHQTDSSSSDKNPSSDSSSKSTSSSSSSKDKSSSSGSKSSSGSSSSKDKSSSSHSTSYLEPGDYM